MNPGGRVASTADGGRLAPYVTELREFFASWQMRFGTPEDLAAFAQALREPGTFREELASLTRSVAYREQGTIGIAEMLELMTVAMGGASIAEAGEAVREPVRELLRFLSKATRGARAEALDNVAPENVAAENVTRDAEPVEVAGTAAVGGVVDLAAEAGEPVSGFHPHAATEFYSRARSMSIGADDREFASETPGPEIMSEGDSAAETTVLERATAPALRPAVSDHAKRRTSRLPSRMFAISAVAGVAVAAVLMMHPWARPAAGPVGEPTVSTVKPAEPAAERLRARTPGFRRDRLIAQRGLQVVLGCSLPRARWRSDQPRVPLLPERNRHRVSRGLWLRRVGRVGKRHPNCLRWGARRRNGWESTRFRLVLCRRI